MIVFCEDCGEKNQLRGRNPEDGTPAFVCSICGYRNPHRFSPDEKRTLDRITPFLKNTRNTGGLSGGFIFHHEAGVLLSRMPSILKKPDLEYLGNTLVTSYRKGQSALGGIQSMALCISGKKLLVSAMGKSLFMILAAGSNEESGLLHDRLDHLHKQVFSQIGHPPP